MKYIKSFNALNEEIAGLKLIYAYTQDGEPTDENGYQVGPNSTEQYAHNRYIGPIKTYISEKPNSPIASLLYSYRKADNILDYPDEIIDMTIPAPEREPDFSILPPPALNTYPDVLNRNIDRS